MKQYDYLIVGAGLLAQCLHSRLPRQAKAAW